MKLTIAEMLRVARENLGLKQSELARFAGVKQATYWAYERDKANPPLWRLEKMFNELGIKLTIEQDDELLLRWARRRQARSFEIPMDAEHQQDGLPLSASMSHGAQAKKNQSGGSG